VLKETYYDHGRGQKQNKKQKKLSAAAYCIYSDSASFDDGESAFCARGIWPRLGSSTPFESATKSERWRGTASGQPCVGQLCHRVRAYASRAQAPAPQPLALHCCLDRSFAGPPDARQAPSADGSASAQLKAPMELCLQRGADPDLILASLVTSIELTHSPSCVQGSSSHQITLA
jgi:hypothetical protein